MTNTENKETHQPKNTTVIHPFDRRQPIRIPPGIMQNMQEKIKNPTPEHPVTEPTIDPSETTKEKTKKPSTPTIRKMQETSTPEEFKASATILPELGGKGQK